MVSSTAAAAAMSASLPKVFQQGLPIKTASSSPVGTWLLGVGSMVVGMISVGGLTRLTQSGLSMTTWSPLGSLPPISQKEWQTEFQRYQQFPEWQQRQSMTLQDFQFIYAWEYGHRMLGRVVGLAFVGPWLYFSLRRKIPAGYQPIMAGLCGMGATQGMVGWWMVKSGLGDDRRGDRHEIRVKPIRLATHLSMAFATYGCLVWNGLQIWSLPQNETLQKIATSIPSQALAHAQRLRGAGMAVTGLTAVTVVSGALVAGNDAGRAYNEFPKMNGEWLPTSILYPNGVVESSTRDTATVQFHHRVLGVTTASVGLGLLAAGLRNSSYLTPQARNGLMAVGIATTGQMTLGIATLLNYVPISLAAVHQLGSVVVFTSGIYLVHALRYAAPSVQRAVVRTASQTTGGGAAAGVLQVGKLMRKS